MPISKRLRHAFGLVLSAFMVLCGWLSVSASSTPCPHCGLRRENPFVTPSDLEARAIMQRRLLEAADGA